MFVGKVIGNVVATKKDERLVGTKLLIVRPVDPEGRPDGRSQVAVDIVGAGIGEIVLVAEGSSARQAVRQPDSPVDAAIVGIVDTMEVEGR
ncbi:MAG: hypothetical protein PWP58_1245 [Bacillota bacterium]|jgi:ethanolamine utilization protein EutN|nr:hypothetical protein [Bacillota bacterium]MDK2784934.1 hypothetical protein [Bacillota bacterium]MDK2882909.1 hypothetical protein [Bacillota bacterium]